MQILYSSCDVGGRVYDWQCTGTLVGYLVYTGPALPTTLSLYCSDINSSKEWWGFPVKKSLPFQENEIRWKEQLVPPCANETINLSW